MVGNMDIMYTCDNNYVWLMGISTISLFENNKHIKELTVYLIGENISDENKCHLNDIAQKYNRQIFVIDVPKLDIPPSLTSARWPLSAFTRLFSGVILPNNLQRILYLDCDTIIVEDIEPLQNIDFGNNIVVAIKDCISGSYKENIGLNKDNPYFNAGVLLLNLEKIRDIDIKREIEEYMHKYVKLINYADQDILNGMFKGKIGVLDPKYDVMTIDVVHSYEEIMKLRRPTNFYNENELKSAVSNPVIVHYTTNMLIVRPWFKNSDHPLKNVFLEYMSISVWKDKVLSEAVFNSIEAKTIGMIMKLPKVIAYRILGLIHSVLKPKFKKITSRIK